ncbi:hypothetical protein O6H91_13G021000 [Diphasiastrum complanatum]|uniref:Uncharacterized protein n=1 Tax=Diphasiastrum complanatum TaxID=34168 RepID=A0ACC2BSS2_DIPCM|nr:hypothetical protein O6H91_13G021000 [Diphasiastrum complanatum]
MVTTVDAPGQVQYEIHGVKIYQNGKVDRSEYNLMFPTTPANPDHPSHGALSRDVIIDSGTGIWVRLYIPERALCASEGEAARLPIILYIHGGRFVLISAASASLHEYCCKIAARIGALVVSLDYRLAPEHKLPTAFEDGLSALKWLQVQGSEQQDHGLKDPWLSAHGDFGSCFIMGRSAGGTVVHQTVFGAAAGDGFDPLKIRGLISVIPAFGGIDRTSSEIEYGETDSLTVKMADDLWALALPEGADRSHPYSTFLTPETQALLKRVELPPSLVVVGAQDPLHDRQIEYVDFLRQAGNDVTLLEYPQYGHDLPYPEVIREEDVEEAYSSMRQFITKCVNRNTS